MAKATLYILTQFSREEDDDQQFARKSLEANIESMYLRSKELSAEFFNSKPKNLKCAKRLKERGNKLFQERKYKESVKVYNEAIIECPQKESKDKKLYAILIGNRSAAFFEMHEYQKVLQDLSFLKQYGHHSNTEKLTLRESKAIAALHIAQPFLKVEFNDDGTLKPLSTKEFNWSSGNTALPAFSTKLALQTTNELGRHVVATEDISAGEILAAEDAYVSVISVGDYETINCKYCALSTSQIYACPNCAEVYCSSQCLENAQVYHQYECSLDLNDCPDNFLLALRMITQRSLEQVIADETNAKDEQFNPTDGKNRDYYNVRRLLTDTVLDDTRSLVVLKSSVLLLRCLKGTNYFEQASATSSAKNTNKSKKLSNNEIFIGSMLFIHLQMIALRSYKIKELVDMNRITLTAEDMQNFDHFNDIGSGLYPAMSVFTHSCDPAVRIFFVKTKLIALAVKPIKTGEVVTISIGPTFFNHPKPEGDLLFQAYNFPPCRCPACEENWPHEDIMERTMIPFRCDCGGAAPIDPRAIIMYMAFKVGTNCPRCNKDLNLMHTMTHSRLEEFSSLMKDAKAKFEAGQLEEGENLCADYLNHIYQYISQPCDFLLTTQWNLHFSFASKGNLIDYSQIS